MEIVKIENPFKVVEYNFAWPQAKKHILNVVRLFPKENRLLENKEQELLILKIGPQFATGNDRLLHVTPVDEQSVFKSAVKYEMSNQKKHLDSYDEQQNLINLIEIFTKLVNLSIDNKLIKTIEKINNKARVLKATKSLVKVLIFIVILVTVFFVLFN